MRIVVLDGYTMNPGDNPWNALAALGELTVYDRSPHEQLMDRAGDADVIVTNKFPLTAADFARLPRLKMIAVTATGYNVVDIEAARRHGVVVCNVPEYGTQTVAQFTFALLLELCHRVGRHADSVARGDWTRCPDFCYWQTPQIELAGRTMGVVGYGRIGRNVAVIARAFGMKVMVVGQQYGEDRQDAGPTQEYAGPAQEAAGPTQEGAGNAQEDAGVQHVDLHTLFSKADVVSLHCPQTPETTGLVNTDRLSLMRPDAMLINTARGPLVVERDLAAALNAGRIAGAAVDVATVEPIRPDNPLLTAKNIIITPHMAWASLTARQRLMTTTAENIRAFQLGRPINVVNG